MAGNKSSSTLAPADTGSPDARGGISVGATPSSVAGLPYSAPFETARTLQGVTPAFDARGVRSLSQLREATLRLRNQFASVMEIETIQVQPSFGSHGSIDAIFNAASVIQHDVNRAWDARRSAELESALDEQSVEHDRVRRRLQELEFQRPSSGVLLSTPTRTHHYVSALSKGLPRHAVPLTADYRFDAGAFVDAIASVAPPLIVLGSPNHVTGVAIPDADLLRVLDATPGDSWVMLDRSLINSAPEVSTRELLAHYAEKNLVVLHSFSNYKGMSEDRVGVGLFSNPEFARQVEAFFPDCLTVEGVAKASYWMTRDGGLLPDASVAANIRANRVILERFAQRHRDFSVSDFSADSALLIVPDRYDAAFVTGFLAARGMSVVPGDMFFEPNSRVIQVHVGDPPRTIRALTNALERLGSNCDES